MIFHFIRFQPEAGTDLVEFDLMLEKQLDRFRELPGVEQVSAGRLVGSHTIEYGRDVADPDEGYTHGLLVVLRDEETYRRYIEANLNRRDHGQAIGQFPRMHGLDMVEDWDEGLPGRIKAMRAHVARA